MILDTCDWSAPGHDPYRGTFIEWVQTLPQEQRAQMLVLQERVERRIPDYDAVVYVDTLGINDASGARDYRYHDNILYMAFGSKGKLCRQVTRHNWELNDVQSGMVFCNENICAVRWSICNNWSIITREGVLPPAPPPDSFESGYVAPVVAPPPAKEVGSEPSTPDSNPSYPPYGGGGYGFGGGYGYGGGYCVTCVPYCPPEVPAVPIPEPGTYALLAAGLGLLALRRSKK